MKILGTRLLVARIPEEKKKGFETVEVTDNFVNKGRVVMVSHHSTSGTHREDIVEGDTVLFAKYSPDTHEVDYEGEKMKIISATDVLAVL